MPYIPPVDIDTFYTDGELDRIYQRAARYPWAVHVTGIDEIHSHTNPELADDDPNNNEFTMRTALKWAAERNSWHDKALANHGAGTIAEYCVVVHDGEPWRPDPKHEGMPGEYCEWFDNEACDWFCNLCLEPVAGNRCPARAPMVFSGLRRVECDKPDAHPPIFMHFNNQWDGYGPFCHYCIASDQREVQFEQSHGKHRSWRWRKSTSRVLNGLYRLRLVKGWTYSACRDGNCCAHGVIWRWAS